MKANKVKSLIIGLLLTQVYAQENNSKLAYHAFSITPIEVIVDSEQGGFGIRADITFSSSKHLFLLDAMAGEEFVIWGGGESYFQFNAKYGREFEISNWFFIDPFIGVGYFGINHEDGNTGVINFPLQLKLRFKTGRRFSLGFNLQSHFNSERTAFSGGVFLQWHKQSN